VPSESVGRDPPGKAHFLVVLSQGRFHGYDLGLHLNDERRACRLVPCEQVDGASLAVHRIRNLGPSDPPGPFEELGDRADEHGMAFVQEAIEVPATPPKGDDQFGVERTGDRANPTERHIVDAATFDPRDGILRLTRAGSEVFLGPGSAVAEPANSTSDP
jgi:hypothetical protein